MKNAILYAIGCLFLSYTSCTNSIDKQLNQLQLSELQSPDYTRNSNVEKNYENLSNNYSDFTIICKDGTCDHIQLYDTKIYLLDFNLDKIPFEYDKYIAALHIRVEHSPGCLIYCAQDIIEKDLMYKILYDKGYRFESYISGAYWWGHKTFWSMTYQGPPENTPYIYFEKK